MGDFEAVVSADPYQQTYDAIPTTGARRRWFGLWRLRRIAPWLVVLASIYVGSLAVMSIWAHRVSRRPTTPAHVAGPTVDQPRRFVRGPEVIGTAPARDKAGVHVGDAVDFAVSAEGIDLRYGWTIDGRPASTGPRWTYVPAAEDVGTRRVEVMVVGREGSTTRGWRVRVWPGHPPEIVTAEPAAAAVEATTGRPLSLSLDTRSRQPGVSVAVGWTVDGKPAGVGRSLTLRPEHAGSVTVRAVATTATGGMASREWRVAVDPPVEVQTATAALEREAPSARETPTARETRDGLETSSGREAPRQDPATARTPGASEGAVVLERPAPALPVRRPPPPRKPEVPPAEAHAASPQEEVRWLLERYAAAWRARDVEALRDLGQISSERAAQALRRYFADLEDFDVEVDLLGLRSEGGRTIVRFVRRDRFRDPSGRMVLEESPPIEKEVVQTPEGLRFAAGRG